MPTPDEVQNQDPTPVNAETPAPVVEKEVETPPTQKKDAPPNLGFDKRPQGNPAFNFDRRPDSTFDF
jgi:hypothetical protein